MKTNHDQSHSIIFDDSNGEQGVTVNISLVMRRRIYIAKWPLYRDDEQPVIQGYPIFRQSFI